MKFEVYCCTWPKLCSPLTCNFIWLSFKLRVPNISSCKSHSRVVPQILVMWQVSCTCVWYKHVLHIFKSSACFTILSNFQCSRVDFRVLLCVPVWVWFSFIWLWSPNLAFGITNHILHFYCIIGGMVPYEVFCMICLFFHDHIHGIYFSLSVCLAPICQTTPHYEPYNHEHITFLYVWWLQ